MSDSKIEVCGAPDGDVRVPQTLMGGVTCPTCCGTGAIASSTPNGAKDRCPKGHPYDSGNTYRRPSTGWRECRACRRADAERRRGGMSIEARHYAPGGVRHGQ